MQKPRRSSTTRCHPHQQPVGTYGQPTATHRAHFGDITFESTPDKLVEHKVTQE
jgi:hypothetical protein